MQVVIAGGHGKIGLRLAALLAGRGDVVTGVVRNPDHVDDLEGAGATAVVLDLESTGAGDLAATLTGADAVVFAAGAGPGSGVDRKDTVDRAAAELLGEAARLAGVRRYLLVSSAGVDNPPAPERGTGGRKPAEPAVRVDEVWAAYVAAKRAAEDAIRAAEHLDWTILRPGSLTDDPGVGRVQLAPPPVPHGSVTRDDTAAVLAALLDAPATAGRVLELREGDAAVLEAVAALS